MKRCGLSSVDGNVRTGLASLIVMTLGVFVCLGHAGDALTDDEGIRRYGLRNGLEVVIVPADAGGVKQPQGEDAALQLWLVLDVGILDEEAGSGGLARVAGVMARHGFGRFEDETVGLMLTTEEERERGGDRAIGVQVTLGHTILTGHAPTGDVEAVRELLSYFSAVLDMGSWAPDDAGFERARSWMRERIAQYAEPSMVARQRWLPRLLGDGVLSTRLDLPGLAELDALTAEDARALAQGGYRPNRATLLVVGDVGGVDLDGMIARSLGNAVAGKVVSRRDAADGLGGERVVFEREPGWEQHQAVLVWADVIEQDGFTDDDLRTYVMERVAEEVIRRRIDRLGIAELGQDSEIGVDRFELGGRVELMQWVIQREGTDDASWRESIALLLGECERLRLHGADRDEIVQSRGGLLAGWHRDAEEWRSMGSRERARGYLWLLMSDRGLVGDDRWDDIATRQMSTIRDEEINAAIKRLADQGSARILVSAGGERSEGAANELMLAEYVETLLAREYAALDPDWMRSLGGELLDERRWNESPERITQHAESGTWGATLGNGVRVWSRAVGNEDRVEINAMLWGSVFRDGTLSEAGIDAAMLSWEKATTEQRDAGWLAVYQETHGLKVRARRVFGGVRISVEGSAGAALPALELLYAMLDRPMIDSDAFSRWSLNQPVRYGEDDPIDRAFAKIYRPDLLKGEDKVVTIDGAQRALTRMAQNARIEVGIAGAIDPAQMLELASGLLGMLSDREDTEPVEREGERSLSRARLNAQVPGESRSVVFGVRGEPIDDLTELRAMILAGKVLDVRLERQAERLGVPSSALDAQIVMSDSLGDRWALMVSIKGQDLEGKEAVVREVMERLRSDGVSADELASVQDWLTGSIDQYFDRAGYWSTRLSTLGLHGRTIEDLWSIREGYRAITPAEATRALREAMDQRSWFRVEIDSETR
jgi:predicted Zn-dependent peptidase